MLPKSIIPYTKQNFDLFLQERDRQLAEVASQIGKTETSKRTGWSMSTVVNACEKHGVKDLTIGRPTKQAVLDKAEIFPNFSEFFIPPKPSDSTENGFDFDSYQPVLSSGRRYVKEKITPIHEGLRYEQPEILPKRSGKIILTQGLFAIVDEDKLNDLNRFTWYSGINRRTIYAQSKDMEKRTVKMHRYLLKLVPGDKTIVDHINGNGLDNRLENLRVTNIPGNGQAQHAVLGSTSKFKGVSLNKPSNRWSCTGFGGITKPTYHLTEVEAARHYDEQSVIHYGEHAVTNHMLGLYTEEDIRQHEELLKISNPIIRRPRKKKS